MKTHKGAKKRLRIRSSGSVKRRKSGLRHLLSHKSSKRKRHLGQMTVLDSANQYQVCRLFQYKGIKVKSNES